MITLKLRGKLLLSVLTILSCSVIVTYLIGQSQRQVLETLSKALVPALNHTKDASMAFSMWRQQYQDAVVLNELDELDETAEVRRQMIEALSKLTSNQKLHQPLRSRAERIREEFITFAAGADPLYRRMITEQLMPGDEQRIVEYGKRLHEFGTSLNGLTELLRAEMDKQLHTANKRRILSIIVHLMLIPLSFLAIYLSLGHFAIKPLDEVVKATRAFEEGNLDYELEVTTSDEIGELAKSFAHMREAIRGQIEQLNNEIAERQLAQKRQEDASQLNARIISASPIGIAIYNQDGLCMTSNSAMKSMVAGGDEHLKTNDLEVLTSWCDGEVVQAVHKAMSSMLAERTEIRSFHDDGQAIGFDVFLVPFEEDEERHVLMMIHDVTEHLRASQALKKSEDDLRITLDSIGDAVIATDVFGKITRMNPVAEKLTGWAQEEAIGQDLDTCFKIINGTTQERCSAPTERVMNSGQVVELERGTILISRNGDKTHIADSAAPIRDAHSLIIGVVLVFRDVSERDHMEEQLRHAQKMDSVGQLAGGIAHDFNNMLGGIQGSAELLSRKIGKESELTQFVDIISDASARAAELTRKLLDFSRKGTVTSTPIDVHDVLANGLELLQRTIDKRIVIKAELEATSRVVIGDPTQLQNMILDLGLNARDAMPEGGQLTISTVNVTLDRGYCRNSPFSVAPGEYIQINVQDTGSGMTPEIADRVFEPFFTTKSEGKGTGLGLAAVYGTVQNHAGEIHVNSEPGRGTVFNIYLPADRNAVPRSLDEEAVLLLGTETILLVDDEQILRATGSRMLAEMGYIPILASDGQMAVEVFRHRKDEIDAVVLDVIMPRMGGRETFEKLREISPDLPVILCSGFNREQNIDQLLEKGASDFIHKPFRIAELGRALKQALEKRV